MSEQCVYVMPEDHGEWYYRGVRCQNSADGGEYCWRHAQECVDCGRRCSHISGSRCAKCNYKAKLNVKTPSLSDMIREIGSLTVLELHPDQWTAFTCPGGATSSGVVSDPESAVHSLYRKMKEGERGES